MNNFNVLAVRTLMDLPNGIVDFVNSGKSDANMIVPSIAIFVIVICGVLMMIPPLRKMALNNLGWAIGGVVVVIAASSVITYAMTLSSSLGS